MAGIYANANSGEVSLSAATAKTVLRIAAPSNHRLLVRRVEVYGKGTGATDAPILCEIMRSSADGTGSAVTLVPDDSSISETLQAAAKKNYTVEPTNGSVIRNFEVHPQTGVILADYMDSPLVIPGGGAVSLRLTAAAGQTVAATINYEE